MMKAFAVQWDIIWQDPPANFRAIEGLLARHVIPPGSLVVLPEMFATGFGLETDRIAEEAGGQTQRFLASLAARLESYVVGGMATRRGDGRAFNEAVVFGPSGELLQRYAKLHPFSFAGEQRHYTGGQELVTFGAGPVRVAPTICYDLRFPEIYRAATCRGATVFCVIANWPAARDAHWRALVTARAIENQAYVVAVNRIGQDPHHRYAGRSGIVSPRGDWLADAHDRACVIQADLDLEDQVRWRREFPVLQDMHEGFRTACAGLWSGDARLQPEVMSDPGDAGSA